MAIQDFEDWSTRVYWDYYFTILQDTPEGYGGAAKKSVVVNDTETGLNYSNADVDDHSDRHEDGGADPISNLGGNVSFPDRSYLLIGLSSDFTTTAGEMHKLPFNTKNFDNNNDFDTANHYFIVPKDGFYWFSLGARVSNYSDYENVFIGIETDVEAIIFFQIQPLTGSWYHDLKISVGYKLIAGNKVWAVVESYNNSVNIDSLLQSTFFCCCLIA